MQIQLSLLAAMKLKILLSDESSETPLAVRVVPLTSGCSTPSLALELTEVLPHHESGEEQGITFVWEPSDRAWMDGLVIDLNRENGKFTIYHPYPPFESSCQLGTML